jgi:hypothetical protein
MLLTLTIDHDNDVPSPCESVGWNVVTFGNGNLISDAPREEYVRKINKDGPIPTRKYLNKIANGLAFWISLYEHSGRVFSLFGEGSNDQWDSTSVAGIMFWNAHPSQLTAKTFDERKAQARSFIAMYTDWAEGNTNRFSLEDEDSNTLTELGGYIGTDDMVKDIEKALENHKEDQLKIAGDGAWIAKFHNYFGHPELKGYCHE